MSVILFASHGGVGLGDMVDFPATVEDEQVGGNGSRDDDENRVVLLVDFRVVEKYVIDLSHNDEDQDQGDEPFVHITNK